MASTDEKIDNDDVAILDVTTDQNSEDHQPLLVAQNEEIDAKSTTPTIEIIRIPSISRYRLTNILRTILFIEFITLLVIWLVGASTHSLVDDITHYRFTTSIFDLVSVSIFKLVAFIIMLTELETLIIARLYQTNTRPLDVYIRYFYTISLIILSICAVAFSIVKLIFVLREFNLSKIYLSSVYLFLIFSSIETVSILLMIPYLKRIHLLEHERTNTTKQDIDLKRLFSLTKPIRWLLAIANIFLLIATGTQIAQTYYFGKIVDQALSSESMHTITMSVLTLFGINFVGSLSSFIRSWLFELAGQKIVYRLRRDIFDAIVKQEVGYFDGTRTGELTNRLSSDTQVLQSSLTANISMLVRFSLQILGSLGVMFYLQAKLTLVLMGVVPVIVGIAKIYGGIVRKLRKKFQDELAAAGATAEESISNMRTVRIFGAESKVSGHYENNLLKSFEVGKKLAWNSGMFMGLIGTLASAGISIVLWYGAKLVHDGDLTAGILASFLMYMLQVALSFGFLASLFTDFMQAVGASERIFDLLDRAPKIPATPNPTCLTIPADFDGYVRFENVNFTYPSRSEQKVLHDITFEIKPGQKVALVGPSGGGKSTIASLIERFYDPESGTIYFGSDPLTSIDPRWLRRNVSFVNQEPSLFACSIRDNIAFGLQDENISLEDIHAVAKQANAHDFVDQFENKYDTMVGERGVRLSGGQRQRIAIARALLMGPKLLLLDEATSALDAESEHLVQEAIERAMDNRTVLVIAHRLSTVRNADLVIVIDQGKIVERGTHDFLVSKDDGIYKKLVLRQLTVGNNSSTTD